MIWAVLLLATMPRWNQVNPRQARVYDGDLLPWTALRPAQIDYRSTPSCLRILRRTDLQFAGGEREYGIVQGARWMCSDCEIHDAN